MISFNGEGYQTCTQNASNKLQNIPEITRLKWPKVLFSLASLWRALDTALSTWTEHFIVKSVTTPGSEICSTCVVGHVQMCCYTWAEVKMLSFNQIKLHSPTISSDEGLSKKVALYLEGADQFNFVCEQITPRSDGRRHNSKRPKAGVKKTSERTSNP